MMGDDVIDDLGPIDYLVVELPRGQTSFTEDMAYELAQLVRSGTIRLYDLLILQKHDDGVIDAFEIDDFDPLDDLRELERDVAEVLAAKDVAHLADAMEHGTTAGVIVWENRWAAPFAASTRRAGGQLIGSGRIPIQAIVASIEADEADGTSPDRASEGA